MKNTDEQFMRKALSLAKKGLSWTRPNPLVGAVIVKDGKIIGQGYHTKFGFPHAEVEALRSAHRLGYSTSGATLYVTLEPCCHVGKTPPCVWAIIQAGIKKVVCSHLDPNPLVVGKGRDILQKHGIEVGVGLLEQESKQLNEGFVTFRTLKRPFIAVKFAASLDGKIATSSGDSKWITNKKARTFARKLRAQYDAILVGKNTVLKDNPHLGCRDPKVKDPLRIILDSTLSLPIESQVFRDTNVPVVSTIRARKEKVQEFEDRGIQVLRFTGKTISIQEVLAELSKRNIQSILVEGGSQAIGSSFDEGLVDKVYALHVLMTIGGKEAPSAVGGEGLRTIKNAFTLHSISHTYFNDDCLTVGYTDKGIL